MLVRRRELELMDQFMDRAAEAAGNPRDAVDRVWEADGLLGAMPAGTHADGAVEELPESLARQLARHNRYVRETHRVKAILSFSCGPSERASGGLVGPGRDHAVRQADLPMLQAELDLAPPGTVLVVIDAALFHSYVKPEFGENLSAEDFTEIPVDPPVWFCVVNPPARPAPATVPPPPSAPARTPAARWGVPGRVVVLAVVITLLLAGGLLAWKLRTSVLTPAAMDHAPTRTMWR